MNAMVKATSESLGLTNALSEFGKLFETEVCIDSSAAKGIAARTGAGEIKHLEAKQLWVQGLVSSKRIAVTKIPRASNISDALTHHWSTSEGLKHFRELGLLWK